MKDSTIFTKFDVRWGFNNIHICEEDQWKGAFIIPFGLFEPTIMFFGFCNGPPTLQSFMNHIFADIITKHWLKIYMDDLGIHTQRDLALHHECTHCVLLCLREHGLSLKLSKCTFDVPHIEFLGMIIGQGKIEMDSVKLSAIKEWKPPASVKGVDLSSDLRTFITNSFLTSPMSSLLLTYSPGRINHGPGPPFNSERSTLLKPPSLQGPYSPFPMSLAPSPS